jgi:hypothetical protein
MLLRIQLELKTLSQLISHVPRVHSEGPSMYRKRISTISEVQQLALGPQRNNDSYLKLLLGVPTRRILVQQCRS